MTAKRKISKARFLELCEIIGLFNAIVHKEYGEEGEDSLPHIVGDDYLTLEIETLAIFVRNFEEKTGLRVNINIENKK